MPQPIPAPRESGFTTTTEAPLYWVAYGPVDADRLLVLHGGPGADHAYLLPQMLHLAEKYNVILYDQRGGGKSKSDEHHPVTIDTHVTDLDAIVKELIAAGRVTVNGTQVTEPGSRASTVFTWAWVYATYANWGACLLAALTGACRGTSGAAGCGAAGGHRAHGRHGRP